MQFLDSVFERGFEKDSCLTPLQSSTLCCVFFQLTLDLRLSVKLKVRKEGKTFNKSRLCLVPNPCTKFPRKL